MLASLRGCKCRLDIQGRLAIDQRPIARSTSCVARRAAHATLRTTDSLNINLATILGPHKGFANGGNEYWYGMEYLKRAE